MALRVRLCAGALALIFYWVALSDVALADSPNAASAREAKAARTSDSLARNGVLDRDAFVRVVLKQNQSLEAARQSARAAAAHVRATGALPDPMIDASLAPLSVGSSNARLGYEFGIRQEVPWFGKLGLERDVAAAEAGAARSDYESTRRDLALAAATLYSQYYVATRSLEINAHHVELMRAMRDSVTASLEAGRGSLRDSLYIQAELAHMEHDAVVLASERDVLIAQMNELLHRAPAAALPAAPAKLERAPAPELNEAQLEREARENRPEISAAKQHARAEQARARRAARDAYPNFTLSTSYNSMWDMPEHRWMVGIGFALPIQSAARAGAEDEANALQSRYESEAERASDRATSEVYIARQRVREAEHVLDVFERQLLPLARQQVEAARADFTASRATLMDVLGTEKDLRSTELNYEIALADDDRRHAELDHALGRMPASNAEDAR